MNILAIESSCDETAAAVVKDGHGVLSNVVASQIDIHAKYGGVVPEVAARAHVQSIIPVVEESLSEAKTKWENIDVIAVTQGPGLIGSLIIGTETARALAILKKKPIIAVNHLEGHIYANWISKNIPQFPLIALLVSGGHTMLIEVENHYKFKIIGQTRDDAAGEAFDKVAQLLSLPYPGGPNISKSAEKGNPNKYKFPIIDLTSKPKRNTEGFLEYSFPSLDFSFSGLKTAVLNVVKQSKSFSEQDKADIAASFQKTIVETLIQNSQRAIAQHKPKSFILSGGVAANPLLRQELAKLREKLGTSFYMPDLKYCTDNAAMIGAAAYHKQKEKACLSDEKGFTKPQDLVPNPNLSLS